MGLFDELLREIGREMLGLPDKPAPRRRQRPEQPKEQQPDRQRQPRADRRAEKAAAPRQDAPPRRRNVVPAPPVAMSEPAWTNSETNLEENSPAAVARTEMVEPVRPVAKKAARAAHANKPATPGAELARRLAHNPQAAREAFIFAEILSPPLALRGDGTPGQAGPR